jgi:hypothetical protein
MIRTRDEFGGSQVDRHWMVSLVMLSIGVTGITDCSLAPGVASTTYESPPHLDSQTLAG